METIYFHRLTELSKNKTFLEEKLKVKLNLEGRKLTIEGETLDEYEAVIVLNAINLGFSARKAIVLLNPEFIYRTINIKSNSRKKNLKVVRGRVIGQNGKTISALENISGAEIVVNENEVGIIGHTDTIDEVITAITNLIRGTKQSNVYRYLEKTNKSKKNENAVS